MTYAPAKFEAAMSNGLGGNVFTSNISSDPRSGSHEALPSTLCDLFYVTAKFEVATVNGLGDVLPRSTLFDLDPCCPVPSTSCDLCTSKV